MLKELKQSIKQGQANNSPAQTQNNFYSPRRPNDPNNLNNTSGQGYAMFQ
jgi:hypothetical protein